MRTKWLVFLLFALTAIWTQVVHNRAQAANGFTHGVVSSSDRATVWFKPDAGIDWVDVHYVLAGQGQQNFRMAWNAASGRYETVVQPAATGQSLQYQFTYNVPPAYDSAWFSVVLGAPPVGTPTFSPGGGNYAGAQSVTIATSTSGADIRYTTDGSTPTASSTRYTAPVSVATSLTLRAIALKSGSPNSSVASAQYVIGGGGGGTVASPTFVPAPGTYTNTQLVTLASATSGSQIRYTTDGSTPTASSTLYQGMITVAASTTIRAIALKSGMGNSPVSTGNYVIQDGADWNGMTTFRVLNQTNGRWRNDQVYWAIIGKDWNTGQFVHVNGAGQLIPMQLGDNGALMKNGQTYTNYFFKLSDRPSITIPAINSARILMSVGGPMYIKVVIDGNGQIGYAGANIENPTDPNIDVYFDFGEMAILPKGHAQQGIFVNTTRVDHFGFPLKLRVQGLGGYDHTVGEPLTETREQLFNRFQSDLPVEFRPLAQTPWAPYRIVAPAHAMFQAGESQAEYLQPYIDQMWSRFSGQDLVFTLENLGTFTGRVIGNGVFRFTGGIRNGTYYINGKPTTSMVLLGNGLLDDTRGAPAGDAGTQLQIQAQVCAALNRRVFANPADWYRPAAFYPAGQRANWYAKFWHDHSIDQLAYGFAYDDVGGFSPSLHTRAPTTVTYTIGW
ncbi:MAG: chitobiase/beta-hexosaminidase C-terminal domain-containing protein [Pseudoxanthomonas sp.]|nr:chitobiase/beta-hexosaminidase C-terminal domain-containing protein [Pseudoxanthomonas sp.]